MSLVGGFFFYCVPFFSFGRGIPTLTGTRGGVLPSREVGGFRGFVAQWDPPRKKGYQARRVIIFFWCFCPFSAEETRT